MNRCKNLIEKVAKSLPNNMRKAHWKLIDRNSKSGAHKLNPTTLMNCEGTFSSNKNGYDFTPDKENDDSLFFHIKDIKLSDTGLVIDAVGGYTYTFKKVK